MMEAGSPVFEFLTGAFWMVSKVGDTNAEVLANAATRNTIERHMLLQIMGGAEDRLIVSLLFSTVQYRMNEMMNLPNMKHESLILMDE